MKGLMTGLVLIAGLAMPGAAPAAPNCAGPLPETPSGLPAPVLITTSCGRYKAVPGGAVVTAPPTPTVRRGGFWWPQEDVGWRNGHVYVIRNGEVIWRSRRAFAPPYETAAGPEAVAFSIWGGGLWIARFDGREHRVGRGNEYPVVWTGAQILLTLQWHKGSGEVFARPESGVFRKRLASRVRAWAVESQSATLFFTTADRRLRRADGLQTHVFADLDSLGFRGGVLLDALGDGLIALKGSDRIVVLRRDGSRFAMSLFPGLKRTSWGLGWFGSAVVGDGAIAFVIDEPDGEANDASDNVFVLREGASSATRLLSGWNQGDVCGHWINLSWRGPWLLYSTSEARVVLFDLADLGHSLDLTAFASDLPGVSPVQAPGASTGEDGYVDNFDITWAV